MQLTEYTNVDIFLNIAFNSLAGIRIWGNNITLRRNLVMMTLWPGSYQDREEPFNYDWNAAIEVRLSKLFTQRNML